MRSVDTPCQPKFGGRIMTTVYRDIKVPIPREKNVICHRTNEYRVEVVIDIHAKSKNGKPSRTRILIGYVADEKMMYPNSNYVNLYPDKWAEITGKKVIKYNTISIGLKAVFELIANSSGLDYTLRSVYGTPDANLMYDTAMCYFLTKQSSAQNFKAVMADHAIFGPKLYSDSYFSNRIRRITETKRNEFHEKWIKYNSDIHSGLNTIGDGSNFPTSALYISRAKGHSKQKLDHGEEDVGCTLLNGSDGIGPLVLDIYPGNIVDYKGLQRLITKYDLNYIHIKKIILDKGYCTIYVIYDLNKRGISYVIMLDRDTLAMKTLINQFGNDIKTNLRTYWIKDSGLFGINLFTQIFDKHDYSDNVCLFFDANKFGKAADFMMKLDKEIDHIMEQLNSGKNKEVTISKDFANFIKIVDENGKKNVVYNEDAVDSKLNSFGFFGIINHDSEATAGKTIYDYNTRSEIEQCIDIIKNELGLHKLSVHDDAALQGKIQIILVALIIYYRLNKAAKAVGKTVMEVVRDLEQIKAEYCNSSYVCVETIPSYLEKILEFFGGDKSIFYTCTQEINDRIKNYIRFPRRRKPGFKPIGTRVQRDENGNFVKKKRGPKGDPEKARQREEATAKREARRQYDANGKPLPLKRGPKGDPEKAKQREEAKARREARRKFDENGNPLPLKRGRIGDPEKAEQRAKAKAIREVRRQYDENGQPLPLPRGRISNAEKERIMKIIEEIDT